MQDLSGWNFLSEIFRRLIMWCKEVISSGRIIIIIRVTSSGGLMSQLQSRTRWLFEALSPKFHS
jgi:hypothetical protein